LQLEKQKDYDLEMNLKKFEKQNWNVKILTHNPSSLWSAWTMGNQSHQGQ
jgi:hypothetical protein